MTSSPTPDPPSPRSISHEDSIALLLGSLAMNEISLSHLIHAEAEAVRFLTETRAEEITHKSVAMLNNTAARILEEASNSQWLSLGKLDRILRLWTDGKEAYDDEEEEEMKTAEMDMDTAAMHTGPDQGEVEEVPWEEDEE